MMEEIWKDIKGFEGRYQVSNLGRIRSVGRIVLYKNGHTAKHKTRILKQSRNMKKGGYSRIALYDKNQKKIHFEVHRIVALHFCEGYKPGLVVNHIDEDVTNNKATNLEFVTHQYNITYGSAKGKPRGRYCKVKNHKIIGQYKGDSLINTFRTLREASKSTGVDANCICQTCLGRQKSAGGYQWRYLH